MTERAAKGDARYRSIVADPPWEYDEGFVTLLGEGPRADGARRVLCATLTDAEYAYAIEHGGEGFFEARYGLIYTREAA